MMVEKSTFKVTAKQTKTWEKLTRIVQSLNSKKLKEFLEDKNRSEQVERYSLFQKRTIQNYKFASSLSINLNAGPIKISTSYFMELDQWI